jgi:hypothetical protein
MASSTTPLGEAVEQVNHGLSHWCRDVADLVQTDIDLMASGQYGLARLASCGLRLLRVNVKNLVGMSEVLADNVALLVEASSSTGAVVSPREVTVTLPLASDAPVTVVSSSLRGLSLGKVIPQSTFLVFRQAPDQPQPYLQVVVVVPTEGIATDTYVGTLRALEGDVVVASVEFHVAIDELN